MRERVTAICSRLAESIEAKKINCQPVYSSDLDPLYFSLAYRLVYLYL